MSKEKKDVIKRKINQYVQISLGVILLDLGFYFFLNPLKLVIGGMLGVSIVVEPLLQMIGPWFTTSIFLYIVNIITLIIGGILLGKDFFIKTIYASLFSPTVMFALERLFDPNMVMDSVSESGKILIALICGGLLCGVGIGIAIKNNGSTGGMDVIQRCMSKYLKVPYSKTMYLTDWVVVFISGFSFSGGISYHIEGVVYGVIAVLATSIIIDTIVLNVKSRRTAYIITDHPIEMRDAIYKNIKRGVTFIDCEGGYTSNLHTMVVCTLDKNEAYRLTDYVKEVDPKAFSYITSCKEVIGEYSRGRNRK